ncbi:hypothetical protein GE09DRAFT_946856 [Coniochaeta sp. 2T2.1]|nr:hypothetical protein GE09DRAFT_946856 [Coniochaeta sp. 2T2.1]
MAPFGRRNHRETWHKKLAGSGAYQCLIGDPSAGAFPFDALRQATDEYVSKLKLEPHSEASDVKLVDIVNEHVDKEGGAREVALLACLHTLTPSVSASILISFRDECRRMSNNARFLQCLTLAHYSCSDIVEVQECRIAEALMRTLAADDLFSSVRELVKVIGASKKGYYLTSSYINHLLDTTHFDTFFQSHLDDLQQKRKLMSLYNEVSWLRSMANLPGDSLVLAILDAQIPSWRKWTIWKPQYLRLMQWEGGNFTERQARLLGHIFDLEGPDTTGQGHGTLKDSLPGCFDNVRVLNQDPAVIDRLLRLLDYAQTVPCSSSIDLFIYLSVENPNPVDEDLLSLAEAILTTADGSCIEGMLLWLKSLALGTGFNDRMVALTKVLPVFDTYPELRMVVGGDISTDVMEVMLTAQLEYCIQLEIGVAQNFGFKIYSFGRAIQATTWIQSSLTLEFLQKLQKFPAKNILESIFQQAEAVQTSTKLMRDYLAATLGGKDDNPDPLLSQLESEMRYWGAGMDADRMSLATTIRGLRYIDTQMIATCQEQILVEDNLLLQDLLPIIRHDTSSACVNLMRLLGRRRQRRLPVHTCWVELLHRLMTYRADQLLSWAAETLPVSHFFIFIEDVKILFPGTDPRLGISDLGLTAENYTWWNKLAREYPTAIQRLETLQNGYGSFKWLYFQEIQNITILLQILQAGRSPTAVHDRILQYLQPSKQIISQVCEVLGAYNRTSEVGQRAYASLLTRHRLPRTAWPRSASESLLVALGQSRGIQHGDTTALNALADLLGLSIAVNNSGFAMARNIFLADYARVIDIAVKLEAVRLTLRVHNPSRTSRFLSTLGVEDARGCVDSDIPEDMGDTIEALGDRSYELCFPLTHLKDHQKLGNGINLVSRMLLVRVSLQQNASFCIHSYPDDDQKGQYHTPWSSTRGPPQGTICTAKPTLFTHILGITIRSFLSDGQRDLRKLYELVLSTLNSPNDKCFLCHDPLGTKLWKPSTCTTCAVTTTLPVEVAASHLLADPPVLDFLLTCVYSAAGDTSALDLLPNCPVPKSSLKAVIDSFPPLPKDAPVSTLLSSIRSPGVHSLNRVTLLSWLGTSFRGLMLTAPESARVPLMPGAHQFLMLNSSPEREATFSNRLITGTGSTSTAPATTGVVFHGTPATRLFKVLTEGLRNMSNTPFMAHGASHGSGIYLAGEPSMSLGYSGGTGVTWKNSAWCGRQVLLGCELAGHTASSYHVIPDEGRVLVRYVFLCPAGFRAPQARLVDGAMKMTYAALRSGVLA